MLMVSSAMNYVLCCIQFERRAGAAHWKDIASMRQG